MASGGCCARCWVWLRVCCCLLIYLAVVSRAQQQQVIVRDLRADLATAANHNESSGAAALSEARADDILGFSVVRGGLLVASAEPDRLEDVWSVTKTWMATLIGVLVQQERISVDDQLDVALPTVDWSQVAQGSMRRQITIAELLAMSSGLEAPCEDYGQQGTVEEVLNSPSFDPGRSGEFSYLCSGSILGYVIYQQTGSTPLEFARAELFPVLGITREVVWEPAHGGAGIQESGHGLVLGPDELVKLGLLYQQGGAVLMPTRSDSDDDANSELVTTQIIPASFTAASRSDQLGRRMTSWDMAWLGSDCNSVTRAGANYGYLKWLFTTDAGPVDCALGHAGQWICTWPERDLVVAITSSWMTDYSSSCKLLSLIGSGLLDFEKNDDGEPTATDANADENLKTSSSTIALRKWVAGAMLALVALSAFV